ncbi:MAG: hypothetical protein GTO18_20630 [Anaerolineales bacterium]|nr:hypothetical protein [Anaerolineales bacterium]
MNWGTIVLTVAVLVQFYFLAKFIGSWGMQLWQLRDMSAVQKSAFMTWSEEFSEYVLFLQEVIPEDARVILPPNNYAPPIDNVGYMQYFLIPREIHNCGPDEIEACVLRVSGSDTYILSIGDFPPRELAEISKSYLEFSDDYGVYVPKP